ncbi:hypothetical protein NBRC116494_33810 [Aurantivibrio plasticivorans]
MDRVNNLETTPESHDATVEFLGSNEVNEPRATAVSFVLEVVGSFRVRSQFYPVDHFPFHIGRAYDNDLIVSDDTVSPRHLVVNHGVEGLTVRNMSRENGTVLNDTQMGVETQSVKLPAKLSIGRTQIRLLQTTTAVAPTKPLVRLSRLTALCSRLQVSLILLFSYLLATIYVAFESQSLWMNSNEVIVGQLLELVLPLAVATVMSFVSHLLTHYWRFPLQLSIASVFLLLQLFLDELYSFVSYLTTSNHLAEMLNIVLSVGLFTLILAWQLRAISHLGARLSNTVGGAIVSSFFVIFVLQDQVGRPEFIGQPIMHTVLRASDLRWEDDIDSVMSFTQQVQRELQAGMNE